MPMNFRQGAGDASDEPLRTLSAALPESGAGPDPRLLRAIHLAGHAVAAEVCGLNYPDLSLDGTPAEPCPYVPRSDGSGRGPARNGTEAAIIASMGGVEAERLAGADPAACIDVARWLTDGESREAEPFLEWLRLKAERAVTHPLRQRVILAVARALLESGMLSSTQIEATALRETALYMRGQ
jgi:hypothetical protein